MCKLAQTYQHIAVAILLSGSLIVTAATVARAQMGGIDTDPGNPGTGGRNTIQGAIFLPGGRRLDRRAKLKLIGISGQQFQLSDDMGAFSFRRLQSGSYTLIVDAGPEFEIATEQVDLIDAVRRRGDPGMIVSVNIHLQPKQTSLPKAVRTVDASVASIPEAARKLYSEALELARDGNSKKAIEKLNEALKIHPGFVLALNELGVQQMRLKQLDKAAESFRAALKLAPDAFHPRLNYGILLLQMKDYKSAASELWRAVEKDDTSATAHFYFGRALVNLYNYDLAEKHLKRAIAIGADEVVEAHRYLAAVYIEKQQPQRAADELEQYLKLSPKAKDADQIRQIIKQLRRSS
jgi:tetratricopeptide (TPR) repeat protein